MEENPKWYDIRENYGPGLMRFKGIRQKDTLITDFNNYNRSVMGDYPQLKNSTLVPSTANSTCHWDIYPVYLGR
jgi:hypothetical protein